MKITNSPIPYQSAFRPACFTLEAVEVPEGIDIEIVEPGSDAPVGVKRIYATGTAHINVAPYARRQLAPVPVCGLPMGVAAASGRVAVCLIRAGGESSPEARLCGGTKDAPRHGIASGAPERVTIRPGEKDEIPFVAHGGEIVAMLVFHSAAASCDEFPPGALRIEGMAVVVVDADAAASRFESLTGFPASALEGFDVVVEATSPEGETDRFSRHYTLERSSGGRRLAWVNRYGAIDYHTFPTLVEVRRQGHRTTIENPAGHRTTATREIETTKLHSEALDDERAGWLAEAFSSPAAWIVTRSTATRIEIEGCEITSTPLRPTVVEVTIRPSESLPSRKS